MSPTSKFSNQKSPTICRNLLKFALSNQYAPLITQISELISKTLQHLPASLWATTSIAKWMWSFYFKNNNILIYLTQTISLSSLTSLSYHIAIVLYFPILFHHNIQYITFHLLHLFQSPYGLNLSFYYQK